MRRVTEYYFDVETTGTDPLQDKIVTIQYQQLLNGNPIGDFRILKEWEIGEKEAVRQILEKGVLKPGWDFVPVGNQLKYDLIFVMEKSQEHRLESWDAARMKSYFFRKPTIDLHTTLVLMNEGKFLGSGLDTFTKKQKGKIVPTLYREKRYDDIVRYVEQEKDQALQLYRELRALLGAFGRRKKIR